MKATLKKYSLLTLQNREHTYITRHISRVKHITQLTHMNVWSRRACITEVCMNIVVVYTCNMFLKMMMNGNPL